MTLFCIALACIVISSYMAGYCHGRAATQWMIDFIEDKYKKDKNDFDIT